MVTVHGIPKGTSDGAANRKIRPLFNPSERKNPTNFQFERHVARLESRQQQQQQQQRRFIIATFLPEYIFESSPVILFQLSVAEEPRNYPANQSRLLAERSATSNSMSDSGFSEITSTKTRTDARHTTRRKSKKKNKKHRQHFRKPTDGSELMCAKSNSSTPSVDMIDSCEGSTLSPKHVGDILFEETFSPSSSVKEASEKAPDSENDIEYNGCSVASVSSASYCDETELSRPTASCLELFGQCNTNNYRYMDNIPNLELMDSSQEPRHASRSGHCSGNTKTPLSSRNERGHSPCETAEFCSSTDGVDDSWLESSNCSSDFSSENGVGVCNGAQAAHLCSDGSRGSDFCLVISRKRARKAKKMSMWKSFNGEHAPGVMHGPNEKYTGRSSRQMIKELNTKQCSRRHDHVDSIQPQHESVLKRPIKNFTHKRTNGIPFKHYESGTSHNQFTSPKEIGNSKSNAESGTSHNHFTIPKQNSNNKSNRDFDNEQNIDLNKRPSNGVHCRESTSSERKSTSASEPTALKSAKGNCTSESSQLTDHVVGDFHMLKRGLQGSLQVNYAIGTGPGLPSPDSKSTETNLLVRGGVIPFVERNQSFGKFCSFGKFSSSEMHLIQMTKVVNDAYEVQVAADAHLSARYPITDLEIFMHSATPVIGHVPCVKIINSSQDQSVSSSICQQYMSNIYLRNIWEWYEEPGCYGLEVRDLNDRISIKPHSTNSEFCAYFVPYLSAIQLFGWSTKNMDYGFGVQEGDKLGASSTTSLLSSQPVPAKLHKPFEQSNTFFSESSFSTHDHGELIYEYFETEQPSFRPPLFEKIKELSSLSLCGDSEKLQHVKLCDLHPASWYCVAWYPVYRVPHGNLRASFLTYHSLGKMVPQMSSPDLSGGQHTRMVCPVVGLQGYNDKGEQWLELRCPDSSKPRCAEIVKERLRTLKQGALAMARAVVPRGSEKSSVNHHPDFEFFLSRST